jgi:hypothetical protein
VIQQIEVLRFERFGNHLSPRHRRLHSLEREFRGVACARQRALGAGSRSIDFVVKESSFFTAEGAEFAEKNPSVLCDLGALCGDRV